MKLLRDFLITFTFLFFIITTATIALFFPCHSLNNFEDVIRNTEQTTIGNKPLNHISSADNRPPFNFSISDFDAYYVYKVLQPFELFEIYQSDIDCALLNSPLLRFRNCREMVERMRPNSNHFIIAELKKWKNHLNECQRNNISNLCITPYKDISSNLVNMRKDIMTVGYVCKCQNINLENFCRELNDLNGLALNEFSDMLNILRLRNLNLDQHNSKNFNFEMSLMVHEPYKEFYGCTRYENEMNSQSLLKRRRKRGNALRIGRKTLKKHL